jgi:predicted nucleotidyltransferase
MPARSKDAKKTLTRKLRTGSLRRIRERRAAYRMLQEPVSKTLPRVVKRIVDTLRPEKIILFGSYAYGTPTPDSDVDLLVVMETTATSADRSWSVSRLLIPRPFPVDILVRTPREITSERKGRNFFMQEIVSHGKVLYERS